MMNGTFEGQNVESPDGMNISIGRLRHDLSLELLFPELTHLTGSIPVHAVPTACRQAVMRNAPTWETLRTSTINQMFMWPMVGPGRIAKIIQFCRTHAGLTEQQPGTSSNLAETGAVRDALGTLGAWARTMDIGDDLESCLDVVATTHVPPSVTDAAAFIESLQLGKFATDQQLANFNAVDVAQRLVDEFDAREQDVLERILTKGIRTTVTLEELSSRYGVTREAIRRQQDRVQERFEQLLAEPRYEIIAFRAAQLRRQCGSATPIELAPSEVIPRENDTIVDEMFAHLAGPYRVSNGWLYLQELGDSPFDLVRQAFDSTADGFVAPLDAMLDDLETNGVHPITAMMLLEDCTTIRVLDDDVVSWTKYEDKVGGVLQHVGYPLTPAEIAERLEMPNKERSIANHLGQSDYAHRVSKNRWAMREWGLTEYRSIVEHMAAELSEGPVDLASLATHLSKKFGVSPNSINMYASMHPMFVLEHGRVRLRGSHEPYRPDTELRESDGCVVIDKAWSYRTIVDHDLLRGSGRPIPEAFAVHIGLHPGEKHVVQCRDHDVKLSWTGLAPTVGSLRWYAQQQRLVKGDYVFLRASGQGELDLRCVRQSDLVDSPVEARLLRLLGISDDTDDRSRESLRSALSNPDTQAVERVSTPPQPREELLVKVSESLGYLPGEQPTDNDLRQSLRRHSNLPRLDPESTSFFTTVTAAAVVAVRQLPELALLHPELPTTVADVVEGWVGMSFDLDHDDPQPARKLILGYVNDVLRQHGLAEIENDSMLYRNLSTKLTAAIRSGSE